MLGGRTTIVYDALVDQIFTTWHYMLCIPATEFFWHAISWKQLEIGIYFRLNEKQEIMCSIQWHHFQWPWMTHTEIYQIFITRRYVSVDYILWWPGVSPFVHLITGRGNVWHQVVQRDPSRTLLSVRPIATDTQQWRDRSIHAVYCYRRAAVVRSVHPCSLLLLELWRNNRVANV